MLGWDWGRALRFGLVIWSIFVMAFCNGSLGWVFGLGLLVGSLIWSFGSGFWVEFWFVFGWQLFLGGSHWGKLRSGVFREASRGGHIQSVQFLFRDRPGHSQQCHLNLLWSSRAALEKLEPGTSQGRFLDIVNSLHLKLLWSFRTDLERIPGVGTSMFSGGGSGHSQQSLLRSSGQSLEH
jgi:hypothetical protein